MCYSIHSIATVQILHEIIAASLMYFKGTQTQSNLYKLISSDTLRRQLTTKASFSIFHFSRLVRMQTMNEIIAAVMDGGWKIAHIMQYK